MNPKFIYSFLFLFLFSFSLVSADASFNTLLPDLDMGTDDFTSIDIDNFAIAHVDSANVLSFVNPETGSGVVLFGDVGGEHTNDFFTVTLTTSGLIFFLSNNEELSDHEFFLGISDTALTSQASDSFTLSITNEETPSQIATINSVILGSSDSAVLEIDDFFTAFNSINLTYNNGSGNVSLLIFKGGTSTQDVGDIQTTLSATSQNIFMTFQSLGNSFSQTMYLEVLNSFGSVFTNFDLSSSAVSGSAPQQIASIPTFQFPIPGSSDHYINENFVFFEINFDDYFSYPKDGGEYNMSFNISDGITTVAYDRINNTGTTKTVFFSDWSDLLAQTADGDGTMYFNPNQFFHFLTLASRADFTSHFGIGAIETLWFNVSVKNDVGETDVVAFEVQFSDGFSGGVAPVQLISLADASLSHNDLYTLDLNDLFSGHTNITISLEGHDNITITHGTGGYEQSLGSAISIELSEVANNSIRFFATSGSTNINLDYLITACNLIGCTSVSSTIIVSGTLSSLEGNGLFATLINSLGGVFPESSDLSSSQRYMGLFIFHTILTIFIYTLGIGAKADTKVLNVLAIFLNTLLFFLLAGLGYVGFGGVVISIVIIAIVFFVLRSFK